METKENLLEPLLAKAERFSKTSFELIKLTALDKTADVSSTLISRLFLLVIVSLFGLTITIAIALWLGELLGKNYYGFLVVALFYAVTGIILYFLHSNIKARVNNSIISQMLN